MKNNILFKLLGLYRYILVLFMALTTSSFAQVEQSTPSGEQHSFSLKEAIDYGLHNQTLILNSKLNETIADQKIREKLGSGLPQISGSAELDDYYAKPVSIIPGSFFTAFTGHPGADLAVSFLLQYQATAGLNASQMIFDGTYLAALKAAKTYASYSREQTKASEIEVVATVTKNYYTAIIDQKNLDALDSTIATTQKNLDDTKAMYTQGFKEKLDVDRITVTLNTEQLTRQSLRSKLDLDYFILKYSIGMPVNATLNLTDKLPDAFPAPVTESSDYAKRIEYVMMQTNQDLAMVNVKMSKAAYLPTLSAFGSISANAYREEFNIFDTRQQWYPTGVIGLKLAIPVFDGFQKDARVKQASLNLVQNQNSINDLKNSIALDVKRYSVTYESNYKIFESQKANLKLAEDVARISKIKFEQGVGSNLEVTSDENALVQAQTSYFTALYNIATALVDLQRAKGILY